VILYRRRRRRNRGHQTETTSGDSLGLNTIVPAYVDNEWNAKRWPVYVPVRTNEKKYHQLILYFIRDNESGQLSPAKISYQIHFVDTATMLVSNVTDI